MSLISDLLQWSIVIGLFVIACYMVISKTVEAYQRFRLKHKKTINKIKNRFKKDKKTNNSKKEKAIENHDKLTLEIVRVSDKLKFEGEAFTSFRNWALCIYLHNFESAGEYFND